MQNRSFDDLIDELLRTLRIRENDIIAELEEVNNRAAARQQVTNKREQNENNEQAAPANSLRRGDRVRIKNRRVWKPATVGPSWSEARERLATVTKITPEQVHITYHDRQERNQDLESAKQLDPELNQHTPEGAFYCKIRSIRTRLHGILKIYNNSLHFFTYT